MDDNLSWMRNVLITTPLRWISMAETIPDDLLTRKPAPKEWSAVECLVHTTVIEAVFCSRLQAFLAGQDFPGYNPESGEQLAEETPTASALAKKFLEMRKESLVILAEVTEADLGQQVRHAELGMVFLRQMLNEWAAHDLVHLVQAETAMMQPFIQGCGPWQVYFADHVIKAEE
jgi:hypothetical protein